MRTFQHAPDFPRVDYGLVPLDLSGDAENFGLSAYCPLIISSTPCYLPPFATL